jgi:hypothetical protein
MEKRECVACNKVHTPHAHEAPSMSNNESKEAQSVSSFNKAPFPDLLHQLECRFSPPPSLLSRRVCLRTNSIRVRTVALGLLDVSLVRDRLSAMKIKLSDER